MVGWRAGSRRGRSRGDGGGGGGVRLRVAWLAGWAYLGMYPMSKGYQAAEMEVWGAPRMGSKVLVT